MERVSVEANTGPRKPRILFAASGSVAAISLEIFAIAFLNKQRWANIMVIAPTVRKHTWQGKLCDNLLTCIVPAWDYSKPFFIAPAMNTFMWNNPFTERYLMIIEELGISLITPVTKRLACGDYGNGAMA
ncbi:unnamed protein product [Ilex paraguariensis]|uniref:Phosphopantothenoylcysteine decarboxylase n=1 Tax=Ilex paraguariensis TaxID=185542 RepID=A0ABC8RLD3_9AQUA